MESLDKFGFGNPLLIEKKLGTVPNFCPRLLGLELLEGLLTAGTKIAALLVCIP
jgi:hypothetical protein